ncbi:MAG TPA: ABC transporter substrate-binding protein [Kofleriaceae bacterium]|nr:ABC transporter substrate-binding protein [Kofleriaceae bacterium]
MSKRNWFIVPTAPRLAALTGACLILAAGCNKKKADGEGGSKPAPGVADKGGGDSAMPGVTATEIKIGQTMPYSGPASAYGVIGKTEAAYFKWLDDTKGGVNGRKINLVTLDDGYSPPKAVEQTHKLVENEGVAFVFNSVGTPSNTAVQKYLNDKKVPQLFVATGADKWGDPEHFPWTMGWQPSYRTEAQIYAKYLMKEKPSAKLCLLYQNDDFGKDYLKGLQEGLGDQFDKVVVKTASYEVSDPTIDSQVVTLQGSGCDALLSATTPKFGAQAIRKVADLGWKPLFFMSNVSVSLTSVLKPAGLDKSTGIITGAYVKDPSDPAMANDAGMNEYRAWAKQNLPADVDVNDANAVYGYGAAISLVQVLTACGNDLSRGNIMKQAASLSHAKIPVLIEGIEVNTTATDFRPIQQMQLRRFNGTNFEQFGEVMAGS